ncbi:MULTISPECIES: allantoate amidohydrolase [unclassified Rathayibacter]|jgi:allantoate deiminase|uniref:allantoate amidohydrolase n=2 Tax=Rathayibacter TaxID=33886 RepID=UPI000CE93A01|nr:MULTISPECIES: allantoate amidohydrolase [unclassified Rathayibacter]PPF48465.1 allantoate amidohydrolase [Rathayibacter sp. AY1A1]PPG84089.1 allantoate amidohydrolase [Rathayibacter sp. AY1H2]
MTGTTTDPTTAPPAATAAPALDAAAIMARCDELAAVSSSRDGIERVYLSPEHARVNAMAARWMTEAGMRTWQDAAGNQCGRYEGATPGLPALLLGSHLDTVPDAGRYDGILGVMLAIAVVSRLQGAGRRLPFAVEVVAFGDEEGTRFGTALLGSRALAGTWDEHWWELEDADGTTLVEAFHEFGLDPSRIRTAARDAQDVLAYLEAHIEQGPYLEEADRALAVVSSIAGARRFALTLTGKAGHAGGVPLDRRRDALTGAAEAVLAVERIAREQGVIATVGRLETFPGAVNVIPGRVEFSLDLRAETDAQRDAAWDAIEHAMSESVSRRRLALTVEETHSAPAVVASSRLQDVVRAGIRATGDAEPMVLFSKAGHDAMAVADLAEYAMLFLRCEGGVSHHPDENVTEADVATALDAFEAAVLALADGTQTA